MQSLALSCLVMFCLMWLLKNTPMYIVLNIIGNNWIAKFLDKYILLLICTLCNLHKYILANYGKSRITQTQSLIKQEKARKAQQIGTKGCPCLWKILCHQFYTFSTMVRSVINQRGIDKQCITWTMPMACSCVILSRFSHYHLRINGKCISIVAWGVSKLTVFHYYIFKFHVILWTMSIEIEIGKRVFYNACREQGDDD